MSGHSNHGSDKGAAFTGLIGGALVIGAILYGIVMWTNAKFAGHEGGEKKTGAVATEIRPVA
ncbi:MAG: hypothetical protein K2R93_14300 [Gemmatimonadaceae bacterium]|nr:hypothetical protein [Gemmatimonadaceae bacterium]